MFPEPKFIINKEKGVVVAIMNGCKTDAIDEILKCNANAHILFTIFNKNLVETDNLMVDERLFLPDTFVGVAHCHPEDEFNETVGKRIAVKKLHKSYNKAKKNVIKDFKVKTERFLENLEKSLNKIETKINK